MARRLEWSDLAKAEVREIYNYWRKRTLSYSYSRKLRVRFVNASKSILQRPFQGTLSSTENVRYVIIGAYKMFYLVNNFKIVILSVFDTRQDPDKIPY
jgi:toxin YoeB